MPLLGAGIIPSGPIGLELQATVRRVFAQMVVVLIYKQNPLLALLLRNAIRASGGVSPYTQPVQTGQYVQSSWIGPAGQFNLPQDVAATVNAEFNMCALATPVSSLGLEQLVTQDAIAVASRLMLKLNDLKNSSLQALTTALFGPPVANVLQMFSLQDAYGNATTAPTYGGLSRVTYPDWQGLVVDRRWRHPDPRGVHPQHARGGQKLRRRSVGFHGLFGRGLDDPPDRLHERSRALQQ